MPQSPRLAENICSRWRAGARPCAWLLRARYPIQSESPCRTSVLLQPERPTSPSGITTKINKFEYPSPRPKTNATFLVARRQTVRTAPSVRSSSFLCAGTPHWRGACRKIACVERSSEGNLGSSAQGSKKKSAKWARDSSWAICPIQLPIRFCRKRSVVLVMWSPLPLS